MNLKLLECNWAVFKTPVDWWLVGGLYYPLYIKGFTTAIEKSLAMGGPLVMFALVKS